MDGKTNWKFIELKIEEIKQYPCGLQLDSYAEPILLTVILQRHALYNLAVLRESANPANVAVSTEAVIRYVEKSVLLRGNNLKISDTVTIYVRRSQIILN